MTGREQDDAMNDGSALADVLAADAWLDAVASRDARGADALAVGLVALLDRVDAEYREPVLVVPPVVAPVVARVVAPVVAPHRRRHHTRRLVVGTAAVATIGALGIGVAAATPGSSLYSVHRVIFGDAREVSDGTTDARRALDVAESILERGRAAGGLTDQQRRAATTLVAAVQDSLRGLHATDEVAALRDRAARDSAAIAALPQLDVVTTPVPVSGPTHDAAAGGGPRGSKDAGGSGPVSGAGQQGSSGSTDRAGGATSGKDGPSDAPSGTDHGSGSEHGSGSGDTGGSGGGHGSGDGGGTGSGDPGTGTGTGTGDAGSGTGDSGSGGSGSGDATPPVETPTPTPTPTRI